MLRSLFILAAFIVATFSPYIGQLTLSTSISSCFRQHDALAKSQGWANDYRSHFFCLTGCCLSPKPLSAPDMGFQYFLMH